MPAFGYWFSGTAFGAFIAFCAAVSTLGYAWFRAAMIEEQIAQRAQNDQTTSGLRATTLPRLSGYYIASDALFRRLVLLPQDISDEDYKTLQQDVDNWSKELEQYVIERFGAAVHSTFLELSTDTPIFHPDPSYRINIAKDRSQTLYAMSTMRKNLSKLIAQTAGTLVP